MPLLSWWMLASVAANAAIIGIEYLNRTQPDLGGAIARTWWLIIAAQVFLYFTWHYAPSLLLAWAFFMAGNTIGRLLMVSLVLGEPLRWWWVLGGTALLVGGSWLVKVGTSP